MARPTRRPAGSARKRRGEEARQGAPGEFSREPGAARPAADRGRARREFERALRLLRKARGCFTRSSAPGTVAAVDGNKLTIDFDKAGRKMVLESFVKAG